MNTDVLFDANQPMQNNTVVDFLLDDHSLGRI